MNANLFVTKDYENDSNWTLGENKPNSNPIKANLLNAQMNISSVLTKDYENELCRKLQKNKPKQTQFQTGHLLVNPMLPKLLNFHLKNSLTGLCNSVKYRFLCSERECFYEKLYGKERAGRA